MTAPIYVEPGHGDDPGGGGPIWPPVHDPIFIQPPGGGDTGGGTVYDGDTLPNPRPHGNQGGSIVPVTGDPSGATNGGAVDGTIVGASPLDGILAALSQPVIGGIPLWVILGAAVVGGVVWYNWPSGKRR